MFVFDSGCQVSEFMSLLPCGVASATAVHARYAHRVSSPRLLAQDLTAAPNSSEVFCLHCFATQNLRNPQSQTTSCRIPQFQTIWCSVVRLCLAEVSDCWTLLKASIEKVLSRTVDLPKHICC